MQELDFSLFTRVSSESQSFYTFRILLIQDSGGNAETDDLHHQPNENETRK